jgi:hypothetical protein
MSNFELIDDYLTNRLSEQEVVAFESQLASDPSLRSDVDLQRQILEGVKKARAQELKSMLNRVPVNTGFTTDVIMARIAAGVIGAGLISFALYFYMKPKEATDFSNAAADVSKKSEQVSESKETNNTASDSEKKKEVYVVVPEASKKTEAGAEKKQEIKDSGNTSVEHKQPRIDVVDPSKEMMEEANAPAISESHHAAVSVSHIAVETDTANKNYNFHYQFAGGKLFLYGPFDKSMYEILEINGDHHAVFFYYKDNYYLLDEKQLKITRLEPIKDASLVRKLKEYRSK